ncbi:hypothetical protein L596_013176 [Steinernema carpocapsae]|nr:hypothetical protein L596_013176 [Steinernema carpocapsae]
MSSTDWEVPSGEAANFAKVKTTEEGFVARIDLEHFAPTYKPEDVDVDVYGFDLQINARKEDPNNPNQALRELHRQYRMPDNVDLETIRMKRNRKNNVVRVEATGKSLQLLN